LRKSDFLVILLSAASVQSEMVQGEVEKAHHLSKENQGRPAILPVRLPYREQFKYPLSAYLNPLNWAYWATPDDTDALIAKLLAAIRTGMFAGGRIPLDTPPLDSSSIPLPYFAAQPIAFELPEGTMQAESRFYEVRESDKVALQTIGQRGVTVTIKGPRQMGKSSLLIRTIEAAAKGGKRTAFLDFQLV